MILVRKSEKSNFLCIFSSICLQKNKLLSLSYGQKRKTLRNSKKWPFFHFPTRLGTMRHLAHFGTKPFIDVRIKKLYTSCNKKTTCQKKKIQSGKKKDLGVFMDNFCMRFAPNWAKSGLGFVGGETPCPPKDPLINSSICVQDVWKLFWEDWSTFLIWLEIVFRPIISPAESTSACKKKEWKNGLCATPFFFFS